MGVSSCVLLAYVNSTSSFSAVRRDRIGLGKVGSLISERMVSSWEIRSASRGAGISPV